VPVPEDVGLNPDDKG